MRCSYSHSFPFAAGSSNHQGKCLACREGRRVVMSLFPRLRCATSGVTESDAPSGLGGSESARSSPHLRAGLLGCRPFGAYEVQLRCKVYVTTPASGHPLWDARDSSFTRNGFAVILASLPRPSATPSKRRGIRRGIKRSRKAMLRCCVRRPRWRLGMRFRCAHCVSLRKGVCEKKSHIVSPFQ